MKILLVDDDSTLRGVVVKSLSLIGHNDVIEADNVEQALELFETNPIELIISDWSMPGLTGGDLIKQIRSKPGCQNFPVLLMSGSRLSISYLTQIGIGTTNYLDKPFGISDLEEKISSVTS